MVSVEPTDEILEIWPTQELQGLGRVVIEKQSMHVPIYNESLF